MKESLIIGMAVGIIIGAVIVSNNRKALEIVESGKKAVKQKIEKLKK